jgi:hypothetical protein
MISEPPMNTVHVEATILADGELHLTDLPCRRGDKVEADIRIVPPSSPRVEDTEREVARAAALAQFLTIARSSTFRSDGHYPSRDELHERP